MGRIGSAPGSSRAKGKGTLDNFISTMGAGGIARPNRYRVFFKGKRPVKAAQYVQMRVAPTLKAQYNTFSVEHSPEAQLFGPYDDDMGHDEDLITRKKTQKSLAGGEAAGGMTSGAAVTSNDVDDYILVRVDTVHSNESGSVTFHDLSD